PLLAAWRRLDQPGCAAPRRAVGIRRRHAEGVRSRMKRRRLVFIGVLFAIVIGLYLLSTLLWQICSDCGVTYPAYNATASAVYATNTAIAKFLEGTNAARTATAQASTG